MFVKAISILKEHGIKTLFLLIDISHASGAPNLCLSYLTEWIDGCPCDQTVLHLHYRQTVQKAGLPSLGFHLHCLLRVNTQPQIRKRTLFTNSMENNAYVDSCQPVHRISGYVGFYEILSTALPDWCHHWWRAYKFRIVLEEFYKVTKATRWLNVSIEKVKIQSIKGITYILNGSLYNEVIILPKMTILLDLLAWPQIKGWLPIYLHLIFEILQFEISSLLNWIFLPAVVCKIQVCNRLKIKFTKLDISNWRITKIECR